MQTAQKTESSDSLKNQFAKVGPPGLEPRIQDYESCLITTLSMGPVKKRACFITGSGLVASKPRSHIASDVISAPVIASFI